MTRTLPTILLTLTATLLLGGCTMTPNTPDSHKTGQQLRTEVIDAMNAAITASGLPDGWAYDWQPGGEPWNPSTEEFLGDLCTTDPGDDGQRFSIDLYHQPVGDPVPFARKMSDFWKRQGYTVTVVGGIDLGDDHTSDLRADRPDGTLYAGVTSSTILFNISIYSECSTDPSLHQFAGPHGYRTFDPSEPNPYHPTNTPTITPYPRP